MLDPLTSLGLVVNIVQLVEFGLKAVSKGRELAQKGSTAEHRHFEVLARETEELCAEIRNQPAFIRAANLEKSDPQETSIESGDGTADPYADTHSAIRNLADETRDVSRELGHMLKGLKIADGASQGVKDSLKRKRALAGGLMKAIWHDHDLKDLRDRLLRLQQQMTLRLTIMQSQASTEILQNLGHLSRIIEEQRSGRLTELENRIAALQCKSQPVGESSNQDDASSSLSAGLGQMAAQTRQINTCIHILNTLRFEELILREDSIAETHQGTFRWIFLKSELGFTKWLSKGNGMFWVTGKPGSGKSTLMKFIARHEHTSDLLSQWAHGKKVVIAHHYFWNAGTSMQKSRVGLLRTLLYWIVYHSPEVALEDIPRRFHDGHSIGSLPWTLPELCKALAACGKQGTLDCRFCFFIDGLDEYRDDHLDLVEFISSLSKSPNIKICVSSRPWNVFTCAYKDLAQGQLTVQDLTKGDISKLVRDRMADDQHFQDLQIMDEEGCANLIRDIGIKSQGVFLWVVLVVRSLLRGLSNEDDLATLRIRLDEYPDTLDDYFQRMFERIEKIYQTHSARIMLTALNAEKPLALTTPKYLAQEISAPDYALQLPVRNYGQQVLGSDQIAASQRYLDARCADLLEINACNICFLHRTARDFLSQRHMKERLNEQAGFDFDVHLSHARLLLAETKSLAGDGAELGVLICELLGCEPSISKRNLSTFRALLDNLDEHGVDIFDTQCSPVAFMDDTENGRLLIDEARGSYEDSVHAFQIAAALVRLRGSDEKLDDADAQTGAEVQDEASDAKLLFGVAAVDAEHSF
ncbi:Vegetative incompatibility protein HET-E-1 [Pseudocercospora fuligena]|uniref:Vegetative incompatibility protein HET-E-1 n=1 Tax=Pseudocercospora fuligena TaxID=685502 RepID=A0A8H6VHH7_9PEZI|nr:Vegetative incompatibility protein HET-E-1 [Pseudocercospora fuligena]